MSSIKKRWKQKEALWLPFNLFKKILNSSFYSFRIHT